MIPQIVYWIANQTHSMVCANRTAHFNPHNGEQRAHPWSGPIRFHEPLQQPLSSVLGVPQDAQRTAPSGPLERQLALSLMGSWGDQRGVVRIAGYRKAESLP